MCLFMIHKHNYPDNRTFDKTADMSVKTKNLILILYLCPASKQQKNQ